MEPPCGSSCWTSPDNGRNRPLCIGATQLEKKRTRAGDESRRGGGGRTTALAMRPVESVANGGRSGRARHAMPSLPRSQSFESVPVNSLVGVGHRSSPVRNPGQPSAATRLTNHLVHHCSPLSVQSRPLQGAIAHAVLQTTTAPAPIQRNWRPTAPRQPPPSTSIPFDSQTVAITSFKRINNPVDANPPHRASRARWRSTILVRTSGGGALLP